ncbi:MAG: Eco57I restriction-modification methylase domain-containing protein [Caldilineaceae bacterium]|nr:Eco57I restriction-modification methylase domain-containing protein [Caldilineaceae bacterium]
MIVTDVDAETLDQKRIQLQAKLDQAKTPKERNVMGQFATPPQLALEIAHATKNLFSSSDKVRFLDPAFGTGAFYGALLKIFPAQQIDWALGYEVDPHYGAAAKSLWSSANLQLELKDFTQAQPPSENSSKANILICNPPYVRHHHLSPDVKKRLRKITYQTTGIQLSGLSGLYCYFLLLTHKWLADDGVACWLIPGEFMDVAYGRQVKEYLLSNVDLIRVHRFNPSGSKFDDALVSSAVLWFRKPMQHKGEHKAQFSFGDSLELPDVVKSINLSSLSSKQKWSKLTAAPKNRIETGDEKEASLRFSDLFEIKRGIATGANKFFILTPEQAQNFDLPDSFLTPILPSPRFVPADEIQANSNGLPVIEKRLFLLNCALPEQVIRREQPALWKYLQSGIEQNIHNRYLCRHRNPWYTQDKRAPAPLLCTYMGRNEQPFRFIFNHSQAITANVYLMLYPKDVLQRYIDQDSSLMREIWKLIRQIEPNNFIAEGRVYGGGLHKLEPRELSNVSIESIRNVLPDLSLNQTRQMSLF